MHSFLHTSQDTGYIERSFYYDGIHVCKFVFNVSACYIFFKGICFQHNNGEYMNNEIIKFVNGDLQIDVTISPNEETVWLTQKQMAELFDVKSQAITRHLKNIYNDEELFKEATCSKMEQVQIEGNRKITRKVDFYNLDAIIAVGYRVNSKIATSFRRWATSILKDYMIKGYAVNQKRLDVLNKTIAIQSRMLASTLNIEEKETMVKLVMNFLNS